MIAGAKRFSGDKSRVAGRHRLGRFGRHRYDRAIGSFGLGVRVMRFVIGPIVVLVFLFALWHLFSRGNPGGVSDAKYTEFKQLAPPRILYSCTRRPTRESLLQRQRECMDSGRAGCVEDASEWGEATTATTVEFVGGRENSAYDKLLEDARADCATNRGGMGNGEFQVLEANKG